MLIVFDVVELGGDSVVDEPLRNAEADSSSSSMGDIRTCSSSSKLLTRVSRAIG